MGISAWKGLWIVGSFCDFLSVMQREEQDSSKKSGLLTLKPKAYWHLPVWKPWVSWESEEGWLPIGSGKTLKDNQVYQLSLYNLFIHHLFLKLAQVGNPFPASPIWTENIQTMLKGSILRSILVHYICDLTRFWPKAPITFFYLPIWPCCAQKFETSQRWSHLRLWAKSGLESQHGDFPYSCHVP